jgi:hypothetical protein
MSDTLTFWAAAVAVNVQPLATAVVGLLLIHQRGGGERRAGHDKQPAHQTQRYRQTSAHG